MKQDHRGSAWSEHGLRRHQGTCHWLLFNEDETESPRDEVAVPSHRATPGAVAPALQLRWPRAPHPPSVRRPWLEPGWPAG